MAGNFVEKVRESERYALDMKKEAQSAAKFTLEDARRQGEALVDAAEKDAAALLAKCALEDKEAADALFSSEEEKAKGEAKKLQDTAESRMEDAIALILERVGDIWQ